MPKTSSVAFTMTTIANTPLRIALENERRVAISIKNISDTDIFYGFDQAVATSGRSQGWTISKNGGSIRDEDSKDEIWVICTAGDKKFHVIEVTKVE